MVSIDPAHWAQGWNPYLVLERLGYSARILSAIAPPFTIPEFLALPAPNESIGIPNSITRHRPRERKTIGGTGLFISTRRNRCPLRDPLVQAFFCCPVHRFSSAKTQMKRVRNFVRPVASSFNGCCILRVAALCFGPISLRTSESPGFHVYRKAC